MKPVRPPLTPKTPPQRRLTISSHVVPQFILAMDSLVTVSVAFVAYMVLEGGYSERTENYIIATVFVWLVSILLMHIAGLYQFQPILKPGVSTEKVVVAFMTTFLFLFAAAFALKISATYSRLWVGTFAIGACVGVLAARLIAARIIRSLADRSVFTRNVVICGRGEQVIQLLAQIKKMRPPFVSVLGLFTDTQSTVKLDQYPCTILGNLNEAPDAIRGFVHQNQIDDVLLALPWSADEQITDMVGRLRELPVNVYLGADLIGFRLTLRQPPDHFGDLPLVEIMGRPLSGWGVCFKWLEDYVLGILLTIPLIPVMLVIALAIKLDSRGPVFFRQKRHGFVNNMFHIYKFRTMQHQEVTEEKTKQATRNDPRITRVGRYLRRWSLDELPQIFNVLNGTMSLIGPRPHALDHNEEFAEKIRGYFGRHRVKPGITGWAQVNGLRGETDTLEKMEQRVKYDIYYVENWSLLFDLRILAKTVLVCLIGRNAY